MDQLILYRTVCGGSRSPQRLAHCPNFGVAFTDIVKFGSSFQAFSDFVKFGSFLLQAAFEVNLKMSGKNTEIVNFGSSLHSYVNLEKSGKIQKS